MIPLEIAEFYALASGPGTRVLDIRESDEIAAGMLPGAQHVPLSAQQEWIGSLGKEEILAIYCRTGRRATLLAETIERAGFKNVFVAVGYGARELLAHHARESQLSEQNEGLLFWQLFEPDTSTYSYVVGDAASKEVAIVDSVREHIPLYQALVKKHSLRVSYLLETHVHADHVTATGELSKIFPGAQIGVSHTANCTDDCPWLPLKDGDVLNLGSVTVRCLYTPGHTIDDMTYEVDGNRLLTGDTLFIDSCGRTDFQAGDSGKMYDSLQRLISYPHDTLVFPGHDYNGRAVTSVREQKRNNRLLALSKEDFIAELQSWDLPEPRHIHVAVPANQRFGLSG